MPKTIVLDWVEYELVLEVEQEPLSIEPIQSTDWRIHKASVTYTLKLKPTEVTNQYLSTDTNI